MALTNIRSNIIPNIPINYTISYVAINEQIDDTYYIYITPNISINKIEYIVSNIKPDIPINNYFNITLVIPIHNIY